MTGIVILMVPLSMGLFLVCDVSCPLDRCTRPRVDSVQRAQGTDSRITMILWMSLPTDLLATL